MNVEESLEDEISFWKALIENHAHDMPNEVIERMAQARQLAERKLLLLHAELLRIS